MTQKEGAAVIEPGHEPGDVPRLMARAGSRLRGGYFGDQPLAVEDLENHGRRGDGRQVRDQREQPGPRAAPAAQPLEQRLELPRVEVIEKVPGQDDVERRVVAEGKQRGKRRLLGRLFRHCSRLPLPVAAVEVLDLQAAGVLRPKPYVPWDGGAEVQDGVRSIVPHLVEQRPQSDRICTKLPVS